MMASVPRHYQASQPLQLSGPTCSDRECSPLRGTLNGSFSLVNPWPGRALAPVSLCLWSEIISREEPEPEIKLITKTEILSQPLKNQTYQSVRTFRWSLSSEIGSTGVSKPSSVPPTSQLCLKWKPPSVTTRKDTQEVPHYDRSADKILRSYLNALLLSH